MSCSCCDGNQHRECGSYQWVFVYLAVPCRTILLHSLIASPSVWSAFLPNFHDGWGSYKLCRHICIYKVSPALNRSLVMWRFECCNWDTWWKNQFLNSTVIYRHCVCVRFGACDRMWSSQVHLVLVLASAFVVVWLWGNMIVVGRLFELGTASLLLAPLKRFYWPLYIVAQNS